jgi:Glycoside hydrolase family 44
MPRPIRSGRNASSPRGRGGFGFLPGNRVWYGALLAFGSLSLDCRKLTADPAKDHPVARPKSITIAQSIYDGSLKPGWQDWGWGTHDLSAGAAKINLSQYGGWILHHDPLPARFGAVVFHLKAPSSSGEFLQVRLANGNGDESFPAVDVGPSYSRPLPNGWLDIYVPWSDLNPKADAFDRITFHAKTSIGADPILFDNIGLTQFDPNAARVAAASAPAKHVRLTVSCTAPGHAISPYIYGIAGDVGDSGATSRRWGGNTTTRYNWMANATNVGKDWYFENGKAPDYRQFLADSRKQHATTALTVPIAGWVAKDATSVGFPISSMGPQRARDPYKTDAGDGARPDGKPIKPGPPTQTSVAAPPDMVQRWVQAITQEDQKTQTRSVQQYILDNEPGLWNANHRDVHPDPVTYDELLDRTIRYGSAIRAADPHALIAGPAEWGWTGYMYSARDAEAGVIMRPDRRAHGDVPLLPWYLQKVHEHDVATGVKVLDVLDVHFYPQGQGVYGPNSDPATAALRLRSTRALWDSTYKDESWIAETIRLIPRLKEWVAQNYPGLSISIGEYNFGGEQHISGALALAEVLGRFGSQGLDYAYYWGAPPKNSPAYWAFRAYRNFDGKNSHFLDRSMDTKMDNDVSLFASRDESGKHVVLIAINLSPTTPAQATIGLNGCAPIATREKFTYDAQSTSLEDQGVKTGGALDETLAPYSINVFDLVLK